MERKRIVRQSGRSAEQIKRERLVRERFQKARPSLESLVASGEYSEPIKQADYLTLMQLYARLKDLRKTQNLSLSDLSSRSGIEKSAISRLENGLAENPTIGTLARLAKSLGKRIRFELEDDQPAPVR